MSVLDQDSKVLARIGEPKSSFAKGALKQVVPVVLVIPDVDADFLALRIDATLAELAKKMVNPHIQGTLPQEDEDEPQKYKAILWGASDHEAEQAEHYKKPLCELDDIQLGRYTAYLSSEYDGCTMITQSLFVPWRSEALAGKIDKLAGSAVRIQICELQSKLNLDE